MGRGKIKIKIKRKNGKRKRTYVGSRAQEFPGEKGGGGMSSWRKERKIDRGAEYPSTYPFCNFARMSGPAAGTKYYIKMSTGS